MIEKDGADNYSLYKLSASCFWHMRKTIPCVLNLNRAFSKQYFGKFLPKHSKLNNRTGKSWFGNTKEVIEMLSKTNG